jgi:hypothetical protein
MKQTCRTCPSKDWKETFRPNEAQEVALFEEFAREITGYQTKDNPPPNGPLRGFHAKLHAGLLAEFQVLGNLPKYAQVGIFAEPKLYKAAVRFSNGESTRQRDKGHEPRGIAIKLVGVPGSKLLEGQENAETQDFLATSHSVTSTVRDAHQFIAFVRASRNRLTLPFTLASAVGFPEAVRILTGLFTTVLLSKVRSMATEQFSGTAPIQFGEYAVKFTVRPAAGTEPALSLPLTDNFLRDELADRLLRGDLMFDFLIQFFVDETRTPIENTSIPWKPADAPFVKVAQLRIPRCDLYESSIQAQSEKIDRLSFTPWHTTKEHRPLGNVMRARRVAYLASSAFRGHRPPEPTSLPLSLP